MLFTEVLFTEVLFTGVLYTGVLYTVVSTWHYGHCLVSPPDTSASGMLKSHWAFRYH